MRNRRIGLVDVLPARTGSAERVDAQIDGIQHHIVHLVHLRHDRHGAGRGMHAALCLGGGHPLHAVRAGFELQHRICAVPDNPRNDFLVAAHFAGAFRYDFHLPALAFGEARIHAEQIAGEQRRFVAAGSGANFQKYAALIVGVLRQQLHLQFAGKLRQAFFPLPDLGFGKSLHFRIACHFLCGTDISLAGLIGMVKLYHPVRARRVRGSACETCPCPWWLLLCSAAD